MATLFRKAYALANKEILVVPGDFNALIRLGVHKVRKEVTKAWETAQNFALNALLDLEGLTLIGNSITQDTSPDLTFTMDIRNAQWEITGMNIISDHYISDHYVTTKAQRNFHISPTRLRQSGRMWKPLRVAAIISK